MNPLPDGWALAKLADVGHWCGGGTPSKRNRDFWTSGTIPWVSPKDMKVNLIEDTEDYITDFAVKKSTTNVVNSGSVLIVTRSGILRHTLPVAVTGKRVALNQDLKALTPYSGIKVKYIAWALRARAQQILRECSKGGTTVQSVETSQLLKFAVPIAPTAEQERIVAAIEEQFSRLDTGVAALEQAQRNLKRMRAAVLQAAVTGKLADVISRDWPVVALTDVATIASGQTPRDLRLDSDGSIPFYKVGDMNAAEGFVMAGARGYLDQDSAARFGLRIRPAGTVIFPKRGGAIATNKKRLLAVPAAYDLNTMGLVPRQTVHPKFLHLWLSTIDLTSLADGSNVPQINHGDLASLQLRLPSLADQSLIIAFAEGQLSRIDRLETTLSAGLKRAAVLQSSILASAFSGELVQQDPSDKSASFLLDCIAAERALSNGHKSSRNHTRRAKGNT
jgi:type I restriction enzyme, S subunit